MHVQVFPPRAAASRPPVLLQTLEAELLEASNSAARLASAGPHQQRDPKLAANLALDAHRQVCACLEPTWRRLRGRAAQGTCSTADVQMLLDHAALGLQVWAVGATSLTAKIPTPCQAQRSPGCLCAFYVAAGLQGIHTRLWRGLPAPVDRDPAGF